MSLYYDLHIHSCLSPCADDDMTPMNIAGMAHIKGLDVIALTDHNCGKNLPAMAAAADIFGLMFIPGIEATTAEEVHLLSYFKDLDSALEYCGLVYDSLPDLKNNTSIFGNQLIYNEYDIQTGIEKKNACSGQFIHFGAAHKAYNKAWRSCCSRSHNAKLFFDYF